jgi:hypothetical protein
MRRGAFAAVVLLLVIPAPTAPAAGWSNGGYSADTANPDYGTHDWIAEHAMRWLPENESAYIRENFAIYLYGTELPDRNTAPGGIGDTAKHHVYYRSNGVLQDNASAGRAFDEFLNARGCLRDGNFSGAAQRAGVMTHYLADMGVFGHVMGASTDWGAEEHHSDYENKVQSETTSNVSAMFDKYLVFDRSLDFTIAYNATLWIAWNTTFGDGAKEMNCTWMDSNCDWSRPVFVDSAGASLNRCVNIIADVLHTLAVVSEYGETDTTPPEITIDAPANGTILDATTAFIAGAASDDKGLQKVELSLDGADWTPAFGTYEWNGTLVLPEGPSVIYARATDTSNNANTTSVDVRVEAPDTAPPYVVITSPIDGSRLTSRTAAVTGTAGDNKGIRGIVLSLDNTTWVNASGMENWSGVLELSFGNNTITARAEDTSGNLNTTSVTVQIDDITPPAIVILLPVEGAVLTNGTVTVSGTAFDDSGVSRVEIGTDRGMWAPCEGNGTWTGNLTLGEGRQIIHARATDFFGNSNATNISVTISFPDGTPPVIIIRYPLEGSTLNSTAVVVVGEAADDRGLLKVEASIDNSTWLPASGTTSWSIGVSLKEGPNTVYARATDTAGNTAVCTVNATVRLPDVSPPSLKLLSPGNGTTVKSAGLRISGGAEDAGGVVLVEASLDGAAWKSADGTANWTVKLALKEGKNVIVVRATDASGNTGNATMVVFYKPAPSSPWLKAPVAAFVLVLLIIFATLAARRR